MSNSSSNAMWGGRFAAGPDAIMEAINASIGFDKRLARQDIDGSLAHAAMLAQAGIITDSDAAAIKEGLLTVLSEIEGGTFAFSTALEDIHMNVEARLKEVIGDPAGRLHTGRSRNDQVATDFRLWVRDQADAAMEGLSALMRALVAQAEAGATWVMPGFTHLQTAQPVTWGHHMLAYVEMFARDRDRMHDARGQRLCLAGPGPRQHQDGAIQRLHRLALRRVEAIEIGLRTRSHRALRQRGIGGFIVEDIHAREPSAGRG